jgi:YHS domain-containing protein
MNTLYTNWDLSAIHAHHPTAKIESVSTTRANMEKNPRAHAILFTTNDNKLKAHLFIRSRAIQMPRDPVCGVILDDRTAKFKITHDGETYYFCSVTCKKKFKRHPMKFVK